MNESQCQGTAWIYERIIEYCEARANGIGGYYRQTSYMEDYFRIFTDAEIGGFCGPEAVKRYESRCAKVKKNKPSFADYVVNGYNIRLALEKNWLRGNNKTASNEEMVSTLCEWWDAWLFPAGHYPRDYGFPRRRLRRVRAALESWIEAQIQSRTSSST